MTLRRSSLWALIPSLIILGLVLVQCSGNAPPPVPSARIGFDEGLRLYDAEKWEKARLAFETVVFNHPGSSIVDSAQYLMAMCYYKEKDPILAAAEFQRLRIQYPTSPLVDNADYMRGLNLLESAPSNIGLDQERTAEAVNEILLFKDSHPLSEHIPEADSLLAVAYKRLSQKDFKTGVLYHKLGQYLAAKIYFQGMIDEYPASPLVPEALYRMGEGQQKMDSLINAVEYFEKVFYTYPDHERAAEARKRVAKIARERDNTQPAESADSTHDNN